MTTNQTKTLVERVQATLVQALQAPDAEVGPDMAFGDIPQWDSMGHMEVMMSLEAEFGIEINADTIGALTSVQLICEYIERNGYV